MRALDVVNAHCPRAKANYVEAFRIGDPDLVAYGVTTKLRLAHFLTTAFHETGDLTILVEDMNYSAKRITQVWPSRYKTIEDALPYAHNPLALAERSYGGRMGNGPEGSGDGFRGIGRGLVQCTGKESYVYFGKLLGIDLWANPDLAIDPRYTLKIALAEWAQKGCNALADKNDIYGIRRRINGGLIGMDDVQDEFSHIWPLMLSEADATFTATWEVIGGSTPAWQVAAPDHSTRGLQEALNRLINAGLKVDGLAGPATRAAVAKFQSLRHITVDGIAGDETWREINAAIGGK